MRKTNDLYATLLSVKKLLAKYTAENLFSCKEENEELQKLISECPPIVAETIKELQKLISECPPIVAETIYEYCSAIKADVSLLENQIIKDSGKLENIKKIRHGIHQSEKVNLFLLGEFSSGKTTLVQQLVKQKSGAISGAPETATLVVHKLTPDKTYCQIYFYPEFKEEDLGNGFNDFLRTYELDQFCSQNESQWTVTQESVEKSDWENSQIHDFIKAAAKYSSAIKKIVWVHKVNQKSSILEYVDLYDFPGTGGKETHNVNIQSALKENKPDIILYLIDTDRGIPEGKEAAYLSEMLEGILGDDCKPKFYWVYSKPSDDLDRHNVENISSSSSTSFLDEKAKKLQSFIDNPNKNEEVMEFSQKIKDYLYRTSIVDARNNYKSSEDDTSPVENAVACTLREYFIDRVTNYIDKISGMIRVDIPKEFTLCEQPLSQEDIHPYIYDILKYLNEGNKPGDPMTDQRAKRIFFEKLYLPENNTQEETLPAGLNIAAQDMYSSITSTVNNIVNTYTQPTPLASGGVKKPGEKLSFLETKKNTVGSVSDKIAIPSKLFNTAQIMYDFNDKYKENNEWASLFYRVQMYHWLMLSTKQDIKRIYLYNVWSDFKSRLNKNLQMLTDYKSSFPYLHSIIPAE